MTAFNYAPRRLSTVRATFVALALVCCSVSASAFDDDRKQIAKQLKHHEQAVKACLRGFREGEEATQQSAQIDIAATEAYLSVLNFPANDPRLAGHLYSEEMAQSPANVSHFSSRLFHYRLNQLTGFRIDYTELLNPGALSDAKAQ